MTGRVIWMSLTGETILVLFFLLPGFISSSILNAIATRKQKNGVASVVEALAFSIWIYALTSLASGDSPKLVPLGESSGLLLLHPITSPKYLGIMLIAAVGTPMLLGMSITRDWHMSILRWLRVTNRTARDTVWTDVFTDIKDRYIVANLTDGRRIYGWPQYYSNDPEEGMLYIYAPYWISEDGDYVPMGRHGILLKAEFIQSIEFTFPVSE